MSWPESLAINAWVGNDTGTVASPLAPTARAWAVQRKMVEAPRPLAAAEPVDLRDWRDDRVGWGIVLPDVEGLERADRARAAEAPPAVQRLLASRPGSPVLRYRADLQNRFLRRDYADRDSQDIALSGSARGSAPGRLPRYLLVVGSPAQIPWELQYALNVCCFTGRLDLEGAGLERYVDALIAGWPGAAASPQWPLVWAVDHGSPDITWLMRRAIAAPVSERLRSDGQVGDGVRFLAGRAATLEALAEGLSGAPPALVVTTSHGRTGPLGDAGAMAAHLGLPVDDAHGTLDPAGLLQRWQPDGAIWYAHACCSAGSDARTVFRGLVPEGSTVERVLEAVAGLGARTAPFPSALLGAQRPARAFVGHVEPTFDWTLRQPETGQVLTDSIQEALYDRMHRARPEPVGMAFDACFRHVGELSAQYVQLVRDAGQAVPGARDAALRTQLAALDRQSMVILGDPTAALPALG